MIIFVGGLIGAGKSSVARGIAQRLGYHYFDLDETKKEVFGRDPVNARLLAEGIPPDLEIRAELYREAIERVKDLTRVEPNVVFDDTLHFRRFRLMLYDAVHAMGHEFIVVWVRADEQVILKRLAAVPRSGHILADPIPLHEQMVRDFEDFRHSLVMCPNDGELDDTLDDLFALLSNVASLDLDHPPTTD